MCIVYVCVVCVLCINVCVNVCGVCADYKCVCDVCIVYKCVWCMYCVKFVWGVHIVYKCVFVCVSASWGEGVSGHKENLFFCPGALILTDSAMSTHFPQARWLTEPQENILLPQPSCPTPAPCEPHGSTESSGWVTASAPHILSVSQEGKVSHPRRRLPRTPLGHVTLTNTHGKEKPGIYCWQSCSFLPLRWKSAKRSPRCRIPGARQWASLCRQFDAMRVFIPLAIFSNIRVF